MRTAELGRPISLPTSLTNTNEEVRRMAAIYGDIEMPEKMVAIAHEIKNPIASALANIQLIKIVDTAKTFQNNCCIIEQELYKINQLVLDVIRESLLRQ